MNPASSGSGRVMRCARLLLGQPRLRALFACGVLLGLASSFVMPYMSLFGTGEVGMSLPVFGAFMTATTLANVLMSSLLARWSDRSKSRRLLLLASGAAGALGYVGYALIRDGWQLFIVAASLLSVASLAFSQLFAHARECLERSQVPATDAPLYMNGFRMAYAASWTLGPALASVWLEQVGFRGLFLCAAAFYVWFVLLVLRFVEPRPSPCISAAAAPPDQRSFWKQPVLLAWFGAFVLVFAAQAISMSNMSLYVLRELGGTERQVGAVFSIAPVFEVPCMLYIGLLATRVDSARLIRAAMVLSAAYYGLLTLVRAPWQIYPLQLLSAIIVAITSGVAITFFQNKLPGQFGTATNLYVNSARIGSTTGYLLFGPVATTTLGHRGAYAACSLLSLTALLATRLLVRAPAWVGPLPQSAARLSSD